MTPESILSVIQPIPAFMRPEIAEHIAGIYARCEEEGECILWTGALNSNGNPYGTIGGKCRNLRRYVWMLANPEKEPPAGKFAVMRCRNGTCLHPGHITFKTRRELGALLSKEGAYTRPEIMARKIAARRAVSEVMSMDLAREIRAATTTAKEEAERRGLSVSMIHGIRQGRFWADRPMHMPVNSVWQLAAVTPSRRPA